MENNGIPLLSGVIPILVITLIQIFLSYITTKSQWVQDVISGTYSVMIENGKLIEKNMAEQKYTITELLEQLRINGYFNLNDIQYVILETDGNLSIVPKSTYNSTPTKDFNRLPIPLILDGKLLNSNLEHANKDTDWLLKSLKNHGINSISETLICILDEYENLFIQKKN
jgi:uncharacterized membrane protein YcaP (DUF421 family)